MKICLTRLGLNVIHVKFILYSTPYNAPEFLINHKG